MAGSYASPDDAGEGAASSVLVPLRRCRKRKAGDGRAVAEATENVDEVAVESWYLVGCK